MTWLIKTIICIIAQLKLKLVNVKSNTYVDSSTEINNKNPKF